jgi:hypothetical protein
MVRVKESKQTYLLLRCRDDRLREFGMPSPIIESSPIFLDAA